MKAPALLSLAVASCDFRVASSRWRGAVVLSPDERRELHARLVQSAGARGFIALDTCNRTAWMVDAPDPAWASALLSAWMVKRLGDHAPDEPPPSPRSFLGEEAARHVLRVAVGLEACVPGEREIAGQVRRALAIARAEGASSSLLGALGSAAGRAVRRLERAGLRANALGVPHVAAELVLAELSADEAGDARTVGVVGMGAMGRKIAALLQAGGARVVPFNRTAAPRHGEAWLPLADGAVEAPRLRAIVVTTGAPAPTVDLGTLAGTRLVVDLGIPPQVAGTPVEGTASLGLDDLVDRAAGAGPRVLVAAEAGVSLALEELIASARKRGSGALLAAAQRWRERLRDDALPSVLDAHVADLPPEQRRRLEHALRGLVREQHRAVLEEAARPSADRP